MTALDDLRKLLSEIPENLTVTRDLVSDLIAIRDERPWTTDDFIGSLFGAVAGLERRLVARDDEAEESADDIPTSGGIEPPFDPSDRPWEQ